MRRYTVTVEGKPFELDVSELDADRFRVSVDGREYAVELRDHEDVSETLISPAMGSIISAERPSTLQAAPPVEKAPIAPVFKATPIAGGIQVKAPMPGVVISIDVTEGAEISRGDTLVTLEAMKMKNAIRSPRDGVVVRVCVESGRQVAHGELLVELRNR